MSMAQARASTSVGRRQGVCLWHLVEDRPDGAAQGVRCIGRNECGSHRVPPLIRRTPERNLYGVLLHAVAQQSTKGAYYAGIVQSSGTIHACISNVACGGSPVDPTVPAVPLADPALTCSGREPRMKICLSHALCPGKFQTDPLPNARPRVGRAGPRRRRR
jgi:hypothetical protein